MRCSSSATRFFSAGSWRNTADAFSQSRVVEWPDSPETNAPASTELRHAALRARPRAFADADVAGDADLPRQHHVVLDHGAAGDADLRGEQRRGGRRVTPWAICTRLSIFVPAPIRVSPTAGRSIVVLAPISTSSSITTSACCGIFRCVPSACGANPNPSLPMTAPSCSDDAVADDDALANRDLRVDHAVVADPRAAGR